mmetsp:Transcript_58536/g.132542  ORF Transcript_58536/g.132542 Transcript_58536/m.132542 type:complete len:108 (+) Transcript_58536:259-582(+)|eukprot:CAMPEP_0172633484 /NCGR_PEP_ID=MMETSP1068-20121228/189728_1 /TAXON_ID=35684 /ORGANISM="Pseudopedinella elastica, Strain CCMP716" /LENGTH=107 /DNA_ID=CAMNT_0013445197 /DNA_START=183 /DNA_END=506 /DNA_ORIENTATION=-
MTSVPNDGSLTEQNGAAIPPHALVVADGSNFVNVGLILWEKSRAEWLKKTVEAAGGMRRPCAVELDVDLVIDRIFSPDSTGELPHPVPLPQLIDLMTDLWEADGLFD